MTRRPALDALRGAAALWVVAHHALAVGLPSSPLAINGTLGVDLFFALSGYLLAAGHARARPMLPWLQRRAWRLLPLHALAFCAVVVPLWASGAIRVSLLGAALLPGVALPGHAPLPAVVLWSLGVEWCGFLLLPWLVRHRWALVALVVAGPVLRLATWWWSPLLVYSAPWCRLDAMAWGALAWGWRGAVPWRPVAWLALAGCVVVELPAPDSLPMALGGYTATAAVSAVIVAGLAREAWAPAWLCRIGAWSYALYLFHVPVLWVAGPWAGPPLALVAAWALTRWVEVPLAGGVSRASGVVVA